MEALLWEAQEGLAPPGQVWATARHCVCRRPGQRGQEQGLMSFSPRS